MKIAEQLGDNLQIPRIDDPRARFYLDNLSTIEMWASLRREAATLLIEGLLDLVEVFASDAEAVGEQIEASANERGTRLELRRPGWIHGVVVGLEWSQSLFGARGQVSMYAGLRQELDRVSQDNQNRIFDIASAVRPTLGSVWTSEKVWPIWRWLRPKGEPLDELELYALARREVWRCWDAVASSIDTLQ